MVQDANGSVTNRTVEGSGPFEYSAAAGSNRLTLTGIDANGAQSTIPLTVIHNLAALGASGEAAQGSGPMVSMATVTGTPSEVTDHGDGTYATVLRSPATPARPPCRSRCPKRPAARRSTSPSSPVRPGHTRARVAH